MANEGPRKKRSTCSGCSRLELASAFHVLQKFRQKIEEVTVEEEDVVDEESEIEVDADELGQLDDLLQWMESKMELSEKLLKNIQVTAKRPLVIKDDVAERTKLARLAGATKFMNSGNMHEFLDMLLNLVAKPSQASARTWVDAFLYRASAMLPPKKKMVVNAEYGLSDTPVATASGPKVTLVSFIDYTVMVAEDAYAEYFLNHPKNEDLEMELDSVLGLFVVEAKEPDVALTDHVPQVVTQLYAAAKKLRKPHMRGTLTNGYEWLFLILSVNSNWDGASYRISARSFSAAPKEGGTKMVVDTQACDQVAGILVSWIQYSCEDLRDDDWFR